jgi:hypothetical protein
MKITRKTIHPWPLPPETTMSTRPVCPRCWWPMSGEMRLGAITCEVCGAAAKLDPGMNLLWATIFPRTR